MNTNKNNTDRRQWVVLTAAALVVLCVVAVLIILQNSGNTDTLTPNQNYATEETYPTPNAVDENSDEAKGVKSAVKTYLDAFVSCDFDLAKSSLHEDDLAYFNFESQSQTDFYKKMFPKIKYKFISVAEYEGVYGVMTEFTYPNMADAIGSIHLEHFDKVIEGENSTEDNDMDAISDKMLQMLDGGQLSEKTEQFYIYAEYIDGKFIPRCDYNLANALLGSYPEVSSELTNTLYESMEALKD